MTEARVEVEGEQFSVEVDDLDKIEEINLAMRAPDCITEAAENADSPEDVDDIEASEEMVDYFQDVLVEATDFERQEVEKLQLRHLLNIGAEVLNVVFEEGTDERTARPVKRVRVTKQVIEAIFTGETAVVGGMPDDASFENFEYDPSRNELQFIFESEEWGEVAEGATIPVHEVYAVEVSYGTKDLSSS